MDGPESCRIKSQCTKPKMVAALSDATTKVQHKISIFRMIHVIAARTNTPLHRLVTDAFVGVA